MQASRDLTGGPESLRQHDAPLIGRMASLARWLATQVANPSHDPSPSPNLYPDAPA